jgi:hypothetical protein
MTKLDVNILNANPDLQIREIVYDTLVVAEYADAMRDGAIFPPVTIFFDGATYWLADGFHRWAAALQVGLPTIEADVRNGSKRDAILFAFGANTTHGLRRTSGDKRKAIMRLLNDAEWGQWSDREIAKHCGVDHKTVGTLRPAHLGNSPDKIRKVIRNGSTYTMDTAKNGKELKEKENYRFVSPVVEKSQPEVVTPAAKITITAHDIHSAIAALLSHFSDSERLQIIEKIKPK